MTGVLPDTPLLRQALEARRRQLGRLLKIRPHPHEGAPSMVLVTARAPAADRALVELVDRFGSYRWEAGRWRLDRPQLRLPGF